MKDVKTREYSNKTSWTLKNERKKENLNRLEKIQDIFQKEE